MTEPQIKLVELPDDPAARLDLLMCAANSLFDDFNIVVLVTNGDYNGIGRNIPKEDAKAMMRSILDAIPVTAH